MLFCKERKRVLLQRDRTVRLSHLKWSPPSIKEIYSRKNVWIQRHFGPHGKKSESRKECLRSVITTWKNSHKKVLKNMQKKLVSLKGKWKRPRDKGFWQKKDFARDSGGLYHECSNHRRDSEKSQGKQKRCSGSRISQRREFRKE